MARSASDDPDRHQAAGHRQEARLPRGVAAARRPAIASPIATTAVAPAPRALSSARSAVPVPSASSASCSERHASADCAVDRILHRHTTERDPVMRFRRRSLGKPPIGTRLSRCRRVR